VAFTQLVRMFALTVTQFVSFFKDFIGDDDILKATKFGEERLNELGRVVAETGAKVNTFGSIFGDGNNEDKTEDDVGILRYPVNGRPYIKVFIVLCSNGAMRRQILHHLELH